MWPELFQYYEVGIGGGVGLAAGWLLWRLPVRLRTRHARKLRKMVLDLRRIEDAFHGRKGPNPRELRIVRVPLRQRIMESWQVWWAEWKASSTPRTPEQVAREAYEKELLGVT